MTEPVTITQDRSSVQLPVSTVLQATTQNSVYLPPSNSLTASSQRTEQEIQDSITFNSYASYLKELYTSMSQSHTSQHWSHLPRCEFVQLAMIGGEGQRREDREEEMVRLAQQGRIETIMSYKEPIDLNNLFALHSMQPLVVLPAPAPPRVILIEGAPGGGKSTLALHICHKWARGDVVYSLGRFDLVVLIYLRDQAIQNATTLADILPARNQEMSKIVASQIQDCDGQNVLFIFDGWDEFPSRLQTNSRVSTIIRQPHKLSLHQSTVLITSRPVSSANLLHIADRRVEILGFTQHQIHEYIEKALNGNSTRIQKLVRHLEEHPVIEGYCYVPLHVAILVHIFLTMKGALPTTLHDLFLKLVLCCIARELETHESESFESYSLDDLPDEVKSKLINLSLLAYEGVMQDKVVFYERDLKIAYIEQEYKLLLEQEKENTRMAEEAAEKRARQVWETASTQVRSAKEEAAKKVRQAKIAANSNVRLVEEKASEQVRQAKEEANKKVRLAVEKADEQVYTVVIQSSVTKYVYCYCIVKQTGTTIGTGVIRIVVNSENYHHCYNCC